MCHADGPVVYAFYHVVDLADHVIEAVRDGCSGSVPVARPDGCDQPVDGIPDGFVDSAENGLHRYVLVQRCRLVFRVVDGHDVGVVCVQLVDLVKTRERAVQLFLRLACLVRAGRRLVERCCIALGLAGCDHYVVLAAQGCEHSADFDHALRKCVNQPRDVWLDLSEKSADR